MKAFDASFQKNNTSYDSYMRSITNLGGIIVHCGVILR